MLNTTKRSELIVILVELRECRPDSIKCIATGSRCFMQKIAKHLGLLSLTVDDCRRPLVAEVVRLIVQRALAGVETVKCPCSLRLQSYVPDPCLQSNCLE